MRWTQKGGLKKKKKINPMEEGGTSRGVSLSSPVDVTWFPCASGDLIKLDTPSTSLENNQDSTFYFILIFIVFIFGYIPLFSCSNVFLASVVPFSCIL